MYSGVAGESSSALGVNVVLIGWCIRTLTEFRTMSVAPYPIQCLRDGKWETIQTDKVLPGDVVSIGESCLLPSISSHSFILSSSSTD